jgi:hypothetical protein
MSSFVRRWNSPPMTGHDAITGAFAGSMGAPVGVPGWGYGAHNSRLIGPWARSIPAVSPRSAPT